MVRGLKITVSFLTPFYLNRLTTIDSILLSLHYGSAYRGNVNPYDDPSTDFIKKENGSLSGSVWFVDDDQIVLPYTDTLIRSLDQDFFRKLFPDISVYDIGRATIKQGSGIYKNLRNFYERTLTSKIYFYIDADPDKVISLLKRLKYVGKKGKYGWGLVRDVKVEDTDDNRGFYLNRYTPSKPLPVRSWQSVIETGRIAYYRPAPPYWLKSDIKPCYMPHTSLVEKLDDEPASGSVVLPENTVVPSMLVARFFELGEKYRKMLKKSGRCIFCGRNVDKGADTASLKSITSGSFTDHDELQDGSVICEDCIKSLKSLNQVYAKCLVAVFYEDRYDLLKGKISDISDSIANVLKGDKLPYHMGWRLSSNRQHVFYKGGCKVTISSLMPVVCRDDGATLFVDKQLLDEAVDESRQLLSDYAQVTKQPFAKSLITSKTIGKGKTGTGLPPFRSKAMKDTDLMERLFDFYRKYDFSVRSMLHFFV